MSDRSLAASQKAATPKVSPTTGPVLQRQCACGNHSMGGECEECKKKNGLARRKSANENATGEVLPSVPKESRSPGGLQDRKRNQFWQPRTRHDFTQVPVNAGILHRDSPEDEGIMEGQPSVELPSDETRGGIAPSQESPSPAGSGPTPAAEPSQTGGGTKAACPTKTVVEKVINKTADGKKYRTGMGAVAFISVQPSSQNRDGTRIVESFKPPTSDCPKEFGINPCTGSSTFIVGAKRESPIFGSLPATRNRFYDFHETRWKGGSLLHDRNPSGKDSCKVTCEQQYSCGGTVIGTHTITRTFTKGKVDSVDVTFVNVTKT